MRKYVAVAMLLVTSLVIAGCSTLNAVGALLGSQVTFTQPQLQQALTRNFPKQYDRLGGLVTLNLTNPRLSIPYGDSRLRLDFDVGFGMLGRDSSDPTGHFALTSALRFDPGTRGLHLQNPSIELIDVPALGGAMNTTSRQLINAWLEDFSREEPVYRFDSSLLDRIGARRISSTDIESGVVVVNLGQD